MEKILQDCREALLIWRTVSKLSLEEVLRELAQLQLSTRRPERIVRESLLRASIRTAALPVEVPWFVKWDEQDGEPPFTSGQAAEIVETEAQPKRRGRKPKKAVKRSADTTAEVSESIAIHMPPVVLTSVAISTRALLEGLFEWDSESLAQLY